MIRSSHKNTPVDEAPLDPKVEAELAALDAALRGEPIDDDGLATLVRDVQAQAPVLPNELRERLRKDVAVGFSRRGAAGAARAARAAGSSGGSRGTVRGSGRWIGFAGAGGGVLIAGALVFFVVSGGGGGSTADSASSSLASAPTQESATAAGAASSGTVDQDQLSNGFSTEQGNAYSSKSRGSASADSATSSAVAPVPDTGKAALNASPQALSRTSKQLTPAVGSVRKVERAVDMAVRVKSGKLDDSVSQVGVIARNAGGYVADSQVSIRTRGAGSARFTLRVSSAQLDATVGKLSALGTVTHQNQQSTDITSSFDSAQQRLADATAVRRALLKALSKAKTSGEIASLRARIADNRATRAALSTQLAQVARRADLSTISLSLSAPTSGAAAAVDDNGTWSLGDAAHDTVRILGTVLGVLLVAAGALLPFAVLGLIGWTGYRVRRRASREAALNS